MQLLVLIAVHCFACASRDAVWSNELLHPTVLLQKGTLRASELLEGQASRNTSASVESEVRTHDIVGIAVLFTSLLMMCSLIPLVLVEGVRFAGQRQTEKTFAEYLRHRFEHWYETYGTIAAVVILGFVAFALIDSGAILYWLFVGVKPWRVLYQAFVWACIANILDENSIGGGVVAIFVTVGGLLIFGLILGFVQERFKSLFASMEKGRTTVVEGDHLLILGYSDETKDLIRAFVDAHEPHGGVLALLDERPREELLKLIDREAVDIGSSTLIVRSGYLDRAHELSMLAAESAKAIVLVPDTAVSREEADAKTICTLLALKGHGWPTRGCIVAQCCVAANRELMESLYPGKVEVVVVYDILAEFMVSSCLEPSMPELVDSMLGYHKPGIYFKEIPDLVGTCFGDCVMHFPDAALIGVYPLLEHPESESNALLCPSPEYEIQAGDHIIAFADSRDSFRPTAKPYYTAGVPVLHPRPSPANSMRKTLDRIPLMRKMSTRYLGNSHHTILILGWNTLIGPLLFHLEQALLQGGRVDIYSPRKAEERYNHVKTMQKRRQYNFERLEIHQLEVPQEESFNAYHALASLPLLEYDTVFVIPDVQWAGTPRSADEANVSLLVKLQAIMKNANPSGDFQPIIQVCADSTAQRLHSYGLEITFNGNKLGAFALAQVAMDRRSHCILSDILRHDDQGFDLDVCQLETVLRLGEELPNEISFAEVVALAMENTDSMRVVAGWTRDIPIVNVGKDSSEHGASGFRKEWDLNPKDKTARRPWSSKDRLVTIINRFRQEEDQPLQNPSRRSRHATAKEKDLRQVFENVHRSGDQFRGTRSKPMSPSSAMMSSGS